MISLPCFVFFSNICSIISKAQVAASIVYFNLIGETYKSLEYLYRIPSQTIGQIVPKVCSVISEVLKDYIKVQLTSPCQSSPTITKCVYNPISYTFMSKSKQQICDFKINGKTQNMFSSQL